MATRYLQGSAKVFDEAIAVEGNSGNRASDHLPVFAEFVFGESDGGEISGGIVITGLLPNPIGNDAGNEVVRLHNTTTSAINVAGWLLRDRAGNEYRLSGTVPAGADLDFTMTTFSMPLNNTGDEVSLIDADHNLVHEVEYTDLEAGPGVMITF